MTGKTDMTDHKERFHDAVNGLGTVLADVPANVIVLAIIEERVGGPFALLDGLPSAAEQWGMDPAELDRRCKIVMEGTAYCEPPKPSQEGPRPAAPVVEAPPAARPPFSSRRFSSRPGRGGP